MFLSRKSKQTQMPTGSGLDIYNTKENEPKSSVVESSDYDFAMLNYTKHDFRYVFVESYMTYIKNCYGITVFNCKFERPKADSNFINFYIYLWDDEPDILYRIEDVNNRYVKAFYEMLSTHNLPNITKETHVQFLVKNIRRVMKGKCLSSSWNEIYGNIKKVFPTIASASYWSDIYVFIHNDQFDQVIADHEYLERMKRYCFDAVKKHDIHHIFEYEQFHIRVDNYENYRSIGGQHYFNSDLMFDCLLF